MSKKAVLFRQSEAVGVITINRSEDRNAINEQVVEQLAEICEDIRFDEKLKAVVITGTGTTTFCSSTDLNSVSLSAKKLKTLPSIASPVASIKCPTIAAINGDAIGQGLELALACDRRISVDNALFGLPHVAAGLIPWDGATQRLQRVIGITRAMEMILMSETLDAKEALQIGLVNKLVTSKEVMPLAMKMAQTLASQSPLALSIVKEAVIKGMDLTLEQGLRLEADLYFLLHTTDDRTEGINAFKEKRSPKFRGR
jgi:enoyl-CoA hydratase/carnithine racemase